VSGNTGASTGPHLHFGVYLTQPWIAIDPWGWTGAAADPWPYDAGNLWLTGNPHDPVPDAPTGVSATISGTSAIVSWSPPAFDGGSPITGYTIRASNGGPAFTIPGGNRTAGVDGLTPGVSYTFTVAAQNAVGGGPASQPTNPVTATAITYTGWFPWYDNASPGMLADNVHLVNPGATPVTGSMSIPGGPAVPVSLAPGAEAYFGFPAGTVGGPVQLALTGQVIASQRVQYFQSFNEVLARQASQASTSLWFGWYDNASPGMHADNVHLVNPSSSTASGTISLPGAASIAFSLAPGASGYYAFPAGTIGGPLHVSASQPVLASQRVQYFQSFDEVPAAAGSAAATNQYLDWYDFASPGMDNDNLHLVNPGSTSATGSISLPGAAPIQFSVPAGGAAHYAFPRGTIGGPVTITSSQPLLASQRVQYFQSFDEVPARSAADASSRLYLNWYDRASPGMDNVNVHLVDVGASPVTGSVGMPGAASLSFALQPGQEAHLAFPPGTIGGPVTVSASGPVIASERVQYYQSFDEVPGAPAT
jgi:hypothetical protein